jgi:hypothetical protein
MPELYQDRGSLGAPPRQASMRVGVTVRAVGLKSRWPLVPREIL